MKPRCGLCDRMLDEIMHYTVGTEHDPVRRELHVCRGCRIARRATTRKDEHQRVRATVERRWFHELTVTELYALESYIRDATSSPWASDEYEPGVACALPRNGEEA